MAIQVQQNIAQEVVEFDEKKLSLIRQAMCKDATQEEFEVFIEICKSTQLNPLFKQIYFIKRGGKPTHQTSIDGLRLIADRTKRYMPGRESTYTYDSKGSLISATSYIKKLAYDGTWHEVASTAFFQEYSAGTGQWPKMPHVMLAKCAEALALRRAFPADMNGLYSKEEMEQADAPKTDMPKSINTYTGEVKPDTAKNTNLISIEEAYNLERDIQLLIAPVDPDYKKRALYVLGIDSFEKLPMDELKRIRANIAKKVEELRKLEVPVSTEDEAVPF